MSELRERLDRELATIAPSAGARADVERRLEKRTRRRRVAAPLMAVLITAAIVGGLTYAFRSAPPGRDVGTPVDGEATAEACDEGPWIKHCPEAEWARSVATMAGLDIVDERAVLIVGTSDSGEFMFWAMDPALHSQVEPLAVEIKDSTMVRAGAVDGIPIYTSIHGEEFVWSVHDLNVWVAEEIIGSPPTRSVIAALVRASSSLPYRTGSAPSTYQRCLPPRVRPTFLPWLDAGEEIPPPRVSYDAAIDRAQLTWSDPAYPEGDAGVGLSVYPHTSMGTAGEETDIVINGVAGRLHRFDEANVVGLSWDLPGRTCNFMELSLVAPDVSRSEAVSDLFDVAQSMR